MEKRRKLVKLSTTRVRNLNPTELQLIFQFLEVPEHARALRVCATWSQAGRQPLSWPSSITCNNDQVDFLIANGCKKPKRVLGFGLGRRNFRPPVQWADHLRVLHLRSVVSHEAPKMSDSTAHTILEGCSNLEQLHWYDLFSLPRDFKWPPKLRELKLQFWIKKETPQWNPGGLPATLELLSVTHESAPGFSRAAYWDNLNDAVPFHCPALHTLVFNACGNVGWVTPPDAPFQSTQLRRLHLNVLLWNVQFNHVLRALVDNPPVLEDLKMPEFFGGPGLCFLSPITPFILVFQTKVLTPSSCGAWLHHCVLSGSTQPSPPIPTAWRFRLIRSNNCARD